MVGPPAGVGREGHPEPAVVRQVLPEGEVAVHPGLGDGVAGVLGGQAGGLLVEGSDGRLVVELGGAAVAGEHSSQQVRLPRPTSLTCCSLSQSRRTRG